MVDGAVHVTQRVEIAIHTPAIADDRHAWFDPFTYNNRQRVGGSVRETGTRYVLPDCRSTPPNTH